MVGHVAYLKFQARHPVPGPSLIFKGQALVNYAVPHVARLALIPASLGRA